MADLEKIGQTLMVAGLSTLAIFIVLSTVGPNTLKYKLPGESTSDEQLYNVHTELNVDVSANSASLNKDTFEVRTVPTSSRTASVIGNFIPRLALTGAKNVVITQTVRGPSGSTRKDTEFGDLGGGQVKTVKFDADAWPPGSYSVKYELSQSCSLIDLQLGVFCPSSQTVEKSFEVPQP